MGNTYSITVNEQAENRVKSLTGRADAEEAMVELVTLAGRGRLQVRPSKSGYAAALRESLQDEAAGRMRTFKTPGAAMSYIRRKISK